MLAVIGSAALKIHCSLDREPMDDDLLGDYDEIIAHLKLRESEFIMPIDSGKKMLGKCFRWNGRKVMVEAEITWPGSTSEELYHIILNDKKSVISGPFIYASADVLYLLKMTHRFKKNSPHFKKTMDDIKLLRKSGATVRPEHQEFYERRLKETLSYQHPKLNQSKKDFFTDDVPYKYDHDSIHKAVKLYGQPAYTYFKEDQSEVKVSKKLWNKLPYEIQLAAVYEESCVLALERSQIPYPKTDRFVSFQIALMKVCTSITSGWFREFAWENYDAVIELYKEATRNDYNYLDCFNYGLENGIVTNHK
jgi:hypothetical protein